MATLDPHGGGHGAVGGPIGGAISAVLGNQPRPCAARLGHQSARQGPRLGDLSVQTSSYGSDDPASLFGTMRVAGTVIWATDLREDVAPRRAGGRAAPRRPTYSYSAIVRGGFVRAPDPGASERIWADGKLLRGSGGRLEERNGVPALSRRRGASDRSADRRRPRGWPSTPCASRHRLCGVRGTLQLADFGNRIPSLTFEVVGGCETSASRRGDPAGRA